MLKLIVPDSLLMLLMLFFAQRHSSEQLQCQAPIIPDLPEKKNLNLERPQSPSPSPPPPPVNWPTTSPSPPSLPTSSSPDSSDHHLPTLPRCQWQCRPPRACSSANRASSQPADMLPPPPRRQQMRRRMCRARPARDWARCRARLGLASARPLLVCRVPWARLVVGLEDWSLLLSVSCPGQSLRGRGCS